MIVWNDYFVIGTYVSTFHLKYVMIYRNLDVEDLALILEVVVRFSIWKIILINNDWKIVKKVYFDFVGCIKW